MLIPMLLGCAAPILGGAPHVLAEATNPDAVWITRPFTTEREGTGAVTLWGLFACYRSAEPEAPKCFLADTAGTEEDLVWPDIPRKYNLRTKSGGE